MTAQAPPYVTEAEYLLRERGGATRHEYYDGKIYAMTGGTEPHNLITGNALAALHVQLRQQPCRVYQRAMRVRVAATGLNTYPDGAVVCGRPEFVDGARDTLTNPVVIIELLSPSTERYDRGMKFQHYRTIETLQDYLLIAQDRPYIEHYRRQAGGEWLLREAAGLDAALTIESIACRLLLGDVYEKVDLDDGRMDIPHD